MYNNNVRINEVMEEIKPFLDMDNLCIIHGGAKGADSLAGRWANQRGIPTVCMEANWQYYDKQAGMIRNEWMIKYCNPDLVIAFPGGRGTAGMCSLAKKYNVDLYEVTR